MSPGKLLLVLTLGTFATVAACGASGRDNASTAGDGGPATSADGAIISDPDGDIVGNAPGDARPPPVGTLTGTVLMPEGTVPLADALVYLTSTVPDPIPSGAYCDKCVTLDSYAFTYSNPNGTFELPAYQTGDQYLVVQKGQFRRYRPITVVAGKQDVPTGRTTLPGKNNAQLGDTIPRMLIWPYAWDHIDLSLKKLGITEFEVFNPGLDLNAYNQKMAEFPSYQMIFFPCSGTAQIDKDPKCGVSVDDNLLNAAKDFVEKGGKLYVTDWSYEYVRQGWKGALTWEGETAQYGSACQGGGGPQPAGWEDPSLRDWMTAIGDGTTSVEGAWTTVKSVNPVSTLDENGNTVTQTPKIWVSTYGTPATVSFQDHCGRVLYSTYHTEGTDSGSGSTLLPQEKALLHVLLEVGVCVGPKPVPPPK